LLALSAVALAPAASANVSLKNGNFFIGYTDLLHSGGIEPKVERVYNSKSSHDGIFGFGWGSDYEVYLKISADGSVVIHENGGGAQNRFTPPNINTGEIDKAVAEMMAAKQKSGAGISGSLAETERQKLRNDARYRNDEWDRLYEKGLVKSRQLSEGTVLRSNKFSYQTINKTKDGYIRRFDNGQVQTFDNAGRLVRMADKNANFLTLGYDKTGHLAFIQDNLNRRMNFTFNRFGKVEKVVGESGKTCMYKYNGNELTYSKDADGNVYEYKYSANGRHNLVEIKYSDATTLQVGYNEVNKNETVKWVKDRDGSLTEYTYTGEGPGGTQYSTAVATKGPDGKVISQSKYEYWEKAKVDGERYTYKLVTEIDGDKTETVYNECCGLPLEITRNNEKTTFEYDTKGHVTKKMTPSEVTELAYDTKSSKVSMVKKYPKTGKGKPTWAQYQYDEHANLVFAKNSEGKGVKIVYDHQGRIKALIDQDKRTLQFTYNDASRPVEISDPSVGSIKVRYTNSGDIQKVDSSGGRKIALQVTSAFQNLLDIIRPAGVTLSF
jgi:YD repeat-containing protein